MGTAVILLITISALVAFIFLLAGTKLTIVLILGALLAAAIRLK